MAQQILKNNTSYGVIRKQINDNFTELYNIDATSDIFIINSIDVADGYMPYDAFNELLNAVKNGKIIAIKKNFKLSVCVNSTVDLSDGIDIYLNYIDSISGDGSIIKYGKVWVSSNGDNNPASYQNNIITVKYGELYTVDISDNLEVSEFYSLKQAILDEKLILVKNNGNSFLCCKATVDASDGTTNIYLQYIDDISSELLSGVQESFSLTDGQQVVNHVSTMLDVNGQKTINIGVEDQVFGIDMHTYEAVKNAINDGSHININNSGIIYGVVSASETLVETYDNSGNNTFIDCILLKVLIPETYIGVDKYFIYYLYNNSIASLTVSGIGEAHKKYIYDNICIYIDETENKAYTGILDGTDGVTLNNIFTSIGFGDAQISSGKILSRVYKNSNNVYDRELDIDHVLVLGGSEVQYKVIVYCKDIELYTDDTHEETYKIKYTYNITKEIDTDTYNISMKTNRNLIYTCHLSNITKVLNIIKNDSTVDLNSVKVNVYVDSLSSLLDTIDTTDNLQNINVLTDIFGTVYNTSTGIKVYFTVNYNLDTYKVIYTITETDGEYTIDSKDIYKYTLTTVE